MITAEDAIRVGRTLLGTPYSVYDCINFIKKIIRTAPGGDPKYTDAHVPALWASYNSSGKYRHLVWRQESTVGAKAGHLIFKGKPLGKNGQPQHVGLVTERGTVLHSSSVYGEVVETAIDKQWTLIAEHRLIIVQDRGDELMTDGIIQTPNGGRVNVRVGPSTKDDRITLAENGTKVKIITDTDGWKFCQLPSGTQGYILGDFVVPIETNEEDTQQETNAGMQILIVDSAGNRFEPVGDFHVLFGGVD